MYEAVHARPDGESTVSRLARTAAEYGYDGIVVRNHHDARVDLDPDRIATVVETYGVDVVDGIEVRTSDRSQASGIVANERTETTIVCYHGGTPARNRFAVENERVDVLAHPMAGEGDVNHVLATAAAENAVRLEFDLRPVLSSHGGQRVKALQGLRKLKELVEDADAPYVVTADADTHLGLRTPRELSAVGERIGLGREWVREGLAAWGELVERNRRIASDSFIEPGVRRGRYETEP